MCLQLNWKQTARNEWADYTLECLEQYQDDRHLPCVYLIGAEPENRMVYVASQCLATLTFHQIQKGLFQA